MNAMMPTNEHHQLIDLVTEATRTAVKDLFAQQSGENFYYISLICSGTIPFLTAWSTEALHRAAAGDQALEFDLKWSYADSPYCCYRLELFEALRPCFEQLLAPNEACYFSLSLHVSEAVMHRLDSEGLFGTGLDRNRIYVGAEVMPPDWTNTERARRLNPAEAIQAWLAEAAESQPSL